MWNHFTLGIKENLRECVPIAAINPNPQNGPVWFDKKSRKLVAKERNLYNKWKKTKAIKLMKHSTETRGGMPTNTLIKQKKTM